MGRVESDVPSAITTSCSREMKKLSHLEMSECPFSDSVGRGGSGPQYLLYIHKHSALRWLQGNKVV